MNETIDKLAAILAEIESYHGVIQDMSIHRHVRALHAQARGLIEVLKEQAKEKHD